MFALEESKVAVRVSHAINRLDDVIKVVNTQAADGYQLDQSVQDMVRKHSPGRSPQSCPSGNFSGAKALSWKIAPELPFG